LPGFLVRRAGEFRPVTGRVAVYVLIVMEKHSGRFHRVACTKKATVNRMRGTFEAGLGEDAIHWRLYHMSAWIDGSDDSWKFITNVGGQGEIIQD
jgi:hypothetical protein